MLFFYSITIIGAFFVSSVFSALIELAPLFASIGGSLEGIIDRGAIFNAIGLISVTSLISGYFGPGPASLLQTPDEYVMMPGPVVPYQLYISKYYKRIVRRFTYAALGVFMFWPVLVSGAIELITVVLLITSLILFFEINNLLGTIASYLKVKLRTRFSSRLRHLVLVPLALLIYLPTIPEFTSSTYPAVIFPSNAVSLLVTEITGVFSIGVSLYIGLVPLFFAYLIIFLILANMIEVDIYEMLSDQSEEDVPEGWFSRLIRGEVDFSHSKTSDRVFWIILKDFWSKMRSPLQFWKYLYVAIGTVLVVYLNVAQPSWLAPIPIPASLSFTAVPAFLLILILFTQMAGIPSLLSFVDEQENIYLLKVSPFRASDIVLAKYLMSLVEISLTAIPIYGFLVYFFRVQGSLYLTALGAPMIMVFCATGVLIGAYVPVFTNEPKNPPVPLAFSFPAVNLGLGGLIVAVVATFSDDSSLLIILPALVIGIVSTFIALSVNALKSYR
jgi:hypothetical protein